MALRPKHLTFLAMLGVYQTIGISTLDGKCNCISIYDCQPLLKVVQKFGLNSAKYIRSFDCSSERGSPNVCCPQEEEQNFFHFSRFRPTLPPPPEHIRRRFSFGPKLQTTSSKTKSRPSSVLPSPLKTLGSFDRGGLPQKIKEGDRVKCGYSDASHNRIVGGSISQDGAWPWIVALGYRTSRNEQPKWLCTGSLISRRNVLTAAHCVFGRSDLFRVRLGVNSLTGVDYSNPYMKDVSILSKHPHPNYNEETFENDIAILTLAEEVQYNARIHPVCLPLNNEFEYSNMIGYHPYVAGWGTVTYNGPASPDLREVQVVIRPTQDCQTVYRRIKTNAVIDERTLCAGYTFGGRDACQGDSGGPLMLPGKHFQWFQIGVVSYGHRCAEPNFPAVYTNVAAFSKFILDVISFYRDDLCTTCQIQEPFYL